MKHLEFTFEQPLWEQILESVPVGGTLDAMRFLAVTESEDEESIEAALAMLDEKDILLD